MSANNHQVLPGLALAMTVATLPFGPLGSLLAYVCAAGLVAYACLRLTQGIGYRFLAGAATTFAAAQVALYLDMRVLSDMIAIVGYLQIVGVGVYLFRRRVRRLDASTLLEGGAVASVGAMFVVLVSRSVSGPSAEWIIKGLTTACAVLLFATLMGRERNKHITAMSIAIAMAVVLELLAAGVPPEHYDRIWSLVWIPVLYAIGLPANERQLNVAPIPARRAFGPIQQVLFNALLIAPLVAIGIGAVTLTTGDVLDLVGLAVVTAIMLTFRFRLLIRQRDWSYGQERKLRSFSDTIISSSDPDDLDNLTMQALQRLIDHDGTVALAQVDGVKASVLDTRGVLKRSRGRFRAVELGDDLPEADWWFETQGRCSTRVRVAVPRSGDYDQPRKYFLAATAAPVNSDIEAHFRAAAAQYSLAVRANMLDAQIQEERANSRFAALSQDINDLVFLVSHDDDHRVLLASSTADQILGVDSTRGRGAAANVLDHVIGEDRSVVADLLDNPLQSDGQTAHHRPDVRLVTASGENRWFEVQVRDLTDTETEGLLVSFADVHDRKMAGLNLQNSEAQFRALVQNSLEVSMLVKPDLTMTYVSPNVGDVFDFTAAHLVGSSLLGFVHRSSEEQLTALLESCLLEGKAVRGEVNVRSIESGVSRLAEVTVNRSDSIGPDTYVMVFRDITARRELEESLLQKSVTDEVTGTLNRSAFAYQTQVALQSVDDEGCVAVIMIELANFSAITNNVGFEGGDQVLAVVADKLRAALRSDDSLSRPTGAEFAVCTTVSDAAMAVEVAERLRALVAEPLSVSGHMHNPRPAVGIAVAEQSRDPGALIQKAIVAMNRSLDMGGSTVVVFEQSMQDEAAERFELAADIRPGIEGDQFALVYQPLISLTTNQVVGFEALLRWHHPERGNVSPGVFIPLAESNGTIIDLGRWALKTACTQMVCWQRRYPAVRDCHMSVNLSASQLEQDGEINQLIEIVRESTIAPELLTIELTESTMTRDPARTREQLGALRDLNINIAIDDFGTGVSGLSHLRDLPFDVIKLDKSYVDTLGVSQEGTRLVQQIIDLANAMGANTVGEGIESPEQVDTLHQMGCQVGQGFYLARPMGGEQLIEWLQAREAGQLVI